VDSQSTESFRDLLLRYRGRTGLTQRDLAARLGASRRTVQEWEAGLSHPSAELLQALIQVLLEAGVLRVGREAAEAQQLWAAVARAAPRMHTPFDEVWLARLLAGRGSTPQASEVSREVTAAAPAVKRPEAAAVEREQDWGTRPDVLGFVGRGGELATLSDWVLNEGCRLVAVLGVGGIGKTILAARVAEQVAPKFQRAYWRSLRDGLPLDDWLAGAIRFVSGQQLVLPDDEAARVQLLLEVLRQRTTLMVLDNFETVLQPGDPEAHYRDGYAGYGRVLQIVAEARHQSCLLLTSRESPRELAPLKGTTARALRLGGLGPDEGQLLLAAKGLSGSADEWSTLIDRFGGNGLALKLVGERIRELFGGQLGVFLGEAGSDAVFGGIRRLLAEQFDRGSKVEQKLLRLLAVDREPLGVAGLFAELGSSVSRGTVLEGLDALRRRSLVELAQTSGPAAFTLQSVVLEYVTDRLTQDVTDEIGKTTPVVLIDQPLIKARAKDYVRQTQERLIGEPIVERLQADYGLDRAEQLLGALLDALRSRPNTTQGYGPGNVVNLLRLLRGHDLRRLDLSRLSIRHAYLPEVEAQDASLAGAELTDAVLADAFDYPIAVALSIDGDYLIAGTPAGDVRMWRVGDRTPIMALQAHTGGVWGVALSGDGRLLATGSENGDIGLWEAGSERPLARFRGHDGAVWDVALSSDGGLLASCSLDGTVKLWDTASARLLGTLHGHTGGVVCLSVSADGRLLASGSEDGTVRLWNSADGQLLAVLQGHNGGVWGVAVSRDGRFAASGSYDETVNVWDTETHRLVATLRGHTGAVRGVALSGDGRLVASGGFDATVRLWESATGRLLAILQGHSGGIMSLALSGDAQLLASSSLDGTVKLWEPETKQLQATLQGRIAGARGVALSADRQLLAAGGFDGKVRLWDPRKRELLSTLQVGRGVMSVALSADGHLLATGCFDGTATIWDSWTGRLLATLRAHTGGVRALEFSRDGQLLASGSFDATVRLWATGTGQLLATLQGHSGPVWRVAVSGDGSVVASGSFDGTVRLWDAHAHQPLATLDGHTSGVLGVALSGDGQLLASGSEDGTVRLWDANSGRPLQTLMGHTSGVWAVALSADGRRLASGSFDGTVRLWDAPNGIPMATLPGDTSGIGGMALSSDGRLVVSTTRDGLLVLYDAESGAMIGTLRNDRRYERLDITGLTGITAAQRAALLALGAVEQQSE
jgi:WD40 repeat protein/transcriptional regulator with XRE-family HTH domain